MARNSDSRPRNASPQQKQELPTLQIPPSVASKARSRHNQLHNNYSNNNSIDEEEPEEEFRILLYPTEPWGRASRSRATAIVPSRRLISSLIEDIRQATDSQDSTDTSRHRRNRRVNNARRVALLKRPRSASTTSASNATESSDDGDSESTFNTPKSTASSTKKKPVKQQRLGHQSLSNTLSMTNNTTSITRAHRTSKKPMLPRKPPRLQYTVTPPDVEDENLDVVIVDNDDEEEDIVVVDEEKETTGVLIDEGEASESDYNPGRTMSQKQRQREKARSHKRNLLHDDEDEDQAVEQGQAPEELLQELDRPNKMPKGEGSYRVIERMDCVVIPVVEFSEKSTAAQPKWKGTQQYRRTITGKFMKKDIKIEPTRTATTNDAALTTQSPIKATAANGARLDSRRTADVIPVIDIDIDAPRQTRSGVRKTTTPSAEPTKATAPVYSQDPAHERRGGLRQAPKAVEPPQKSSSVPGQPKIFHGWWLKRKDSLVQDSNLGILVQGNMLVPKAMTWHTSTIKDAPEPTLVMTFTGSLYRLNGSIDVEKMESNGFSKDVIRAFRNGFPSNWKTILSRDSGKQVVSAVSMDNERLNDKSINTPAQDGLDVLKRQEKSLAQQLRESAQRERSLKEQPRPPGQEERQTVVEITPKDDPPRRMRDAPRRDDVVPVQRTSTQFQSVSLPARTPALATPTGQETIEIVIPVVSAKSLSTSYAMSRTTKGPTSMKSEPRAESSPSVLSPKRLTTIKKGSASAGAPSPATTPSPVLARADIREGAPASGPLSSPRRASVPVGANLQGGALGLRRLSAPDQSSAGMGAWKAASLPTMVGIDRSLDNSLDGNLRMRSMAVVEQIREHTRQHLDVSAGAGTVDSDAQDGGHQPEIESVVVVEEEEQVREIGGRPATTLQPLAKSLSSISNSSQSQFDDFDLDGLDEVNFLGKA